MAQRTSVRHMKYAFNCVKLERHIKILFETDSYTGANMSDSVVLNSIKFSWKQ